MKGPNKPSQDQYRWQIQGEIGVRIEWCFHRHHTWNPEQERWDSV
jgi:hypothetical protein